MGVDAGALVTFGFDVVCPPPVPVPWVGFGFGWASASGFGVGLGFGVEEGCFRLDGATPGGSSPPPS